MVETEKCPENLCCQTILEPVCRLPKSSGGRIVSVYTECIAGNCNCVHLIGGSRSQLKPCVIGNVLFSNDCSLDSDVISELWDGVCDSFKIVDDTQIPT